MSYEINVGIDESELKPLLEKALIKYGRYNGLGVDFTDAEIAPIVMCTVICDGDILLVKRGYGLADAEGYWSTVNGFIDEIKPVCEVAQQELSEELGVNVDLEAIEVAPSYTLRNTKEKRRYIVFPCLVRLDAKPDIALDRENTEFVWIKRGQLGNYETLDDLPYAIDQALGLQKD